VATRPVGLVTLARTWRPDAHAYAAAHLSASFCLSNSAADQPYGRSHVAPVHAANQSPLAKSHKATNWAAHQSSVEAADAAADETAIVAATL